MQNSFDAGVDRKNTACIKWDFQKMDYGRDGLIPFSIADADYPTCKFVVDALVKRVQHGVIGYSDLDEDYYASVVGWCKRRHGWDVKKEWITSTNGIVPSLSYAIEVFTSPGDKVAVQPPVYDPFYSVVKASGRQLVLNELVLCDDGSYKMDFADLEAKFREGVKLFILCSPHNPVCRVWTREELERVAELCRKYDVLLVSDEIHWDLMLFGTEHTTMGVIEGAADRIIVCTSCSKTFNLAGLEASNVIIPNDELRERFQSWLFARYLFCANTIGLEAYKAAYSNGDEWVDAQLEYLTGNAQFTLDYLAEKAPEIRVAKPEGTYLLWLDMRAYGLSSDELVKRVAEKGAGLNNGHHYGERYDGFLRMNIACPRAQLKAGLDCVLAAVKP